MPEDLRKYHGISEDTSAAHYFKSSKQVLDLMLQENEFQNRAEIRKEIKKQISHMHKRQSAPAVHNFDSAQVVTKPFKKASKGESGENMAENDPYQMDVC